MTVLNDREIAALATDEQMISPFADYDTDTAGRVSYGLTSFGYDIRVANEWACYNGQNALDLKDPRTLSVDRYEADQLVIHPGEMILCRSVERFRMPANVVATVLGKSSYARLGLLVNVTPLEPGWHGTITIELSNVGHRPIVVHANEGIAQVQFHTGTRPDRIYSEKTTAKYQGQNEVTLPKVQQ